MTHRAAISANALTLPPTSSTKLEIVGGRQRVVKYAIFFAVVGKWRRSVYEQLDGRIVLADECTCRIEYPGPFFPDDCADNQFSFEVTPSMDCPIDCHKAQAFQHREEA